MPELPFYLHIVGFLVCAAVIIYSGTRLSFYGDKIADLTGMGKAWIGLILMASVTSLPELLTGISSVAIIKEPDLAAGDIFGSCVFNLLILSILDARLKQPLSSTVKSSHIVAAIFGIVLLSVAGMSIFLAHEIPVLLWISLSSLVLIGIYLIAVWGIFKYEQVALMAAPAAVAPFSGNRSAELKKAIGGYAFNALLVIGAAVFLPYFGNAIALNVGISQSFFGTLFIAAATSLPELVVSFAALRMGAVDMAVGNLLGSNVFNMFILAIDDVFYREGSLYRNIDPAHLVSIFVIIIMSAVTGLGLLFHPKRKQFWLLSADSFIILLLYLALILHLFFTQ